MNRPLRPTDRNIDIRMRVLGVFGFLLLAGVFFSIGVFCIGPWLRSSHQEAKPPQSTPAYVPPQERRPAVKEEQAEEKGPDIKLEVTESEEEGAPGVDESTESEPPQEVFDVKTDEKSMTITLDGKGRRTADKVDGARVPTAVEPKRPTSTQPKNAATPKSGSGSNLEKPRASTEKRDIVYRVQAGTYGNRSNADDLAAKLKNDGYRRVKVATVQTKDRTLYRVEVAEYNTREDAEELAKDLGATGYTPAVVERPK